MTLNWLKSSEGCAVNLDKLCIVDIEKDPKKGWSVAGFYDSGRIHRTRLSRFVKTEKEAREELEKVFVALLTRPKK